MERPRRMRPAAIDITWLSCRGVRSTLPFHTPCLYASIFVTPSSARGVHGSRRPHRVKTPTDRAGGVNPEWDEPLRLYLPEAAAAASSSPAPAEAVDEAGRSKKDDGDDDSGAGDVLLLRFEIKAEVAVIGDVLTASAAVPVPDLAADGRTRRVSYQLAGPDGRQPNGIISFSYAFHERSGGGDDDDGHSSDGEPVATPPSPAVSSPAFHAPPTTAVAAPRLYPVIECPPVELIPLYPPPVTTAQASAAPVTNSRYYPPPPSATPAEQVAAYPPLQETTRSRSLYPPVGEAVVPASGMYPTVDNLVAPVSWYPPPAPAPALYASVECGYAAAPGLDDRCLYG